MKWGEFQAKNSLSSEANISFFGLQRCEPNYAFKGNNIRDEYVIHYIKSGKGIFLSANNHFVSLKKGDMFILPRNIPCFYKADSKNPWIYQWIGFSGIQIQSFYLGSQFSKRNYLRNVSRSKTLHSFLNLFNFIHKKSTPENDVLTEALVYRFFSNLTSEFPNKLYSKKVGQKFHFNSLLNELKQNISKNNFSITKFSKENNISRSYLNKMFLENTGITPTNYLLRLRMEKAKVAISSTSKLVKEIAKEVGYTDEYTFSKAFKRYTGLSPIYYRESLHMN